MVAQTVAHVDAGQTTGLARAQVIRLLTQLHDSDQLVAAIMYTSGLRAADVLQLRVRDLGPDCIYLHNRRGMLRRIVSLPPAVFVPLIMFLDTLRPAYSTDRAAGVVVPVPNGLVEGDDPAASWRWRFLFAAPALTLDADGTAHRGHADPARFRNTFGRAARAAGLPARVTPQALRDAYANHQLALAARLANDERPQLPGRQPKVTGLDERRAARSTLATLDDIGLVLVRTLYRNPGEHVLPDAD